MTSDVFEDQLFDAHCHLQLDPIYSNIDDVINHAKANGVNTISVCGVNVGKDWNRVTEIYNNHKDMIIPSYGIHPWWILSDDNDTNTSRCCLNEVCNEDVNGFKSNVSDNYWQDSLILELTNNPKSHVGEVGLDKNIKKKVPMQLQTEFLTAHLKIAAAYKRVVSLHCVGCWGKLLEILRVELTTNDDRSNVGGILLHSCNSLPSNLLKEYLALPVTPYFSLNGKIPHANEEMKKVIRAIPLHLLLIETDSPDQLIPSLAEEGLQFNEPAHLVHSVRVIANILELSMKELSQLSTHNANNLFKKPLLNDDK